MHGGIGALETRKHPGPTPRQSEAALRIAEPLLTAPVADRTNWTLARLAGEIEKREGFSISRSQLSKARRKKGFRWRRPRHTLKGRQDANDVDRIGLRLKLRKQQAEAGDIVLLFADESEALTSPVLGQSAVPICAWRPPGNHRRSP